MAQVTGGVKSQHTMRVKRRHYIFFISLLFIIFLTFLLVSYSNAKRVANKIMEPTKPDIYMVECNFTILSLSEGRPVDQISGVGWQVLYNTDKYFANNLEIYVSLTGKIVGTNPVDLRERIKEVASKEKNS